MANFFVVRHAQSVWNAEHRWSGQCDPPLSPAGRDEAHRIAERFYDADFHMLASSGLRRALHTARIIGEQLNVPVTVLHDLRERGAGEWAGLTSDEIEAAFPGQLARWRRGELVHPPGAEEWRAYAERVLRALRYLVANVGGSSGLVVAHLGTLRVLEEHLAVEPLPTAALLGVQLRTENGVWEWEAHVTTDRRDDGRS